LVFVTRQQETIWPSDRPSSVSKYRSFQLTCRLFSATCSRNAAAEPTFFCIRPRKELQQAEEYFPEPPFSKTNFYRN